MNKLFVLNRWRWYARLPTKWAILALTVLAVCFPNPAIFFRHLAHISDPNALIEPDAPALQPFVEELQEQLGDNPSARVALKRIERYVYQKIPYDWDWNTWGSSDYLPTVTEVIQMGREDCDGQAVLAASLLRRFGFQAQLVSDFAHMWVKTDRGEIMGPNPTKAFVATKEGFQFRLEGLAELPRATAFGVAVFPWTRELIVLVVLWLLLLSRSHRMLHCVGGLVLLIVGLLVLRGGGEDYDQPILWMQWVGLGSLIGGCVFMFSVARLGGAPSSSAESCKSREG